MIAVATTAIISCSKEQFGDPYMLFEIHGKVVDVDGNPIKGIQVASGISDVQTTNVNGNFTFYGKSAPSSMVVLTFEDKDGADNGGEFVSRSMEVSLNEKTPGSLDGSFKGTFFAGGVEVVLLKKADQMNPDAGLTPL